MASKILALIMVSIVVVAAVTDFDDLDEETQKEIDFIKRDPELQDLFKAEKRGATLRKYKYCPQFNQDCWCSRRSVRILFCTGVAGGENLYAPRD